MNTVDTTTKLFGQVIAHVIPGFVGMMALSLQIPVVSEWLNAAPGQSAGVGFLFAILGSLGLGLTFAGFRQMTLEHWLEPKGHRQRPTASPRRDPAIEAAYQANIQDHYRYYQFYSGLLVASWFAAAVWLFTEWPLSVANFALSLVILAILTAVLWKSAKEALKRYCDKRVEILHEPSVRLHT